MTIIAYSLSMNHEHIIKRGEKTMRQFIKWYIACTVFFCGYWLGLLIG